LFYFVVLALFVQIALCEDGLAHVEDSGVVSNGCSSCVVLWDGVGDPVHPVVQVLGRLGREQEQLTWLHKHGEGEGTIDRVLDHL